MDRAKGLALEIDDRLRAKGREERRKISTNYFPTAMEVIGVTTPDLRAIVKDVTRRLKGRPRDEVLALVRALLEMGTFEGRQVAYEMAARHRTTRDGLDRGELEELGEGMDNWATVDTFSRELAGQAWREGQISDEVVLGWAGSDDRWWRRCSLVSTVALNLRSQGGRGDTPRTLRLCGVLAGDEDAMVAKGLSWALRELAKRDPEAVSEFLADHDDELVALVKREVRNKLKTGLKVPGKSG